jgi:hypothetical protein
MAGVVMALIIGGMVGGCASVQTGGASSHPSAPVGASLGPSAHSTAQGSSLGALFDPTLDLRAGPVELPLALRIPSLRLAAPILGVGMTADDVMDAPKGPIDDPVWHKAFWYRGGGIPGDVGTATLAGHVNDPLGRPALFARLDALRTGDPILIHDTRSGLEIHFTVVKREIYSARQADDPEILAQIYGSGPVSGQGPLPASDGLAHLTLITCSGSYVNGSFDQRLVIYATRDD